MDLASHDLASKTLKLRIKEALARGARIERSIVQPAGIGNARFSIPLLGDFFRDDPVYIRIDTQNHQAVGGLMQNVPVR